jgi:tripartite-type tricarboxylate transporter receptor subunit TctC
MAEQRNKLAVPGIAVLALLLAIACGASAQSYPERPISFVVPFAAGGATDALARQFAERMARNARQPIIVENIAGAGGTIGAARVAKARADGYTYLIGHMGYMAAATGLYKDLPYDPVKDFEAVARFPDTPMVLVCGRNGRFDSIGSMIDFAKKNPTQVNMGNAGIGSAGHLVAALFAHALKASVTHVSYKGNAPAIIDIISGRIDCMFDQSNTALPQVRGEKLMALASTSKERLSQMPNVPTMVESGLAGFEAATWYGIYAPKGTAAEAIAWAHARFTDAMQDAQFTGKLVEQGYVLLASELTTAAALTEHTRKEGSLWRKVISEAGIAPN